MRYSNKVDTFRALTVPLRGRKLLFFNFMGSQRANQCLRPSLRDEPNDRRAPARIQCFIKVLGKFRLEDIARLFPDTFPVSESGAQVAKVMFTNWETKGALRFPL
jgi:hypothetical protein